MICFYDYKELHNVYVINVRIFLNDLTSGETIALFICHARVLWLCAEGGQECIHPILKKISK